MEFAVFIQRGPHPLSQLYRIGSLLFLQDGRSTGDRGRRLICVGIHDKISGPYGGIACRRDPRCVGRSHESPAPGSVVGLERRGWSRDGGVPETSVYSLITSAC